MKLLLGLIAVFFSGQAWAAPATYTPLPQEILLQMEADFDGDGIKGTAAVTQTRGSHPYLDLWVNINNKELHHFPKIIQNFITNGTSTDDYENEFFFEKGFIVLKASGMPKFEGAGFQYTNIIIRIREGNFYLAGYENTNGSYIQKNHVIERTCIVNYDSHYVVSVTKTDEKDWDLDVETVYLLDSQDDSKIHIDQMKICGFVSN